MKSVQGHKRTNLCYLNWMWLQDQPHTFSVYCLKRPFSPTPFSLTCCWFSFFDLALPVLGVSHLCVFRTAKYTDSRRKTPFLFLSFGHQMRIHNVKSAFWYCQFCHLVDDFCGGKTAFLKGPLDSSSPTQIYRQFALCVPLPLLFCLSVIFHFFNKYLLGAYCTPRSILYLLFNGDTILLFS